MLQVFGLTGGIGSGKSSVAAHLRARGLKVIDADRLAREIVEPGEPALRELVEAFGASILDETGRLKREALAALVFGDDSLRKKLNAITHPRVRELSAKRFGELASAGEPLACYEVPLLFETGLEALLKPVVVVSAPEALQIERASARDGATPEAILARVRSQMPLAEKVRRADYVIDNSGPLAASLRAADEVLIKICKEYNIAPERYGLSANG